MRRREFIKGSLAAGVGALGVTATTAALGSSLSSSEYQALLTATDLRCESLATPLGIDANRPRLSWKLTAPDDARNQFQAAYRILVASSPKILSSQKADLWDSGRVASKKQLHIEYAGTELKTGQRCFWQVEVWDAEGVKSAPGSVSWWEMGLLSAEDWTGSWISDGKELPKDDAGHYENDPAPLFRRSFQVDKPVERARLYATALGYGEFCLNGQKVSDHVLDPAWTSTEETILYTSHDVTAQVEQGENVLGAMLGNGWRNPLPLKMWGRINVRESLPLGRPAFISELVIEYVDGTTTRVSSDDSWRKTEGPLLRNSVYLGENYDARLEKSGWDRSGFDDSDWAIASEVDSPSSGTLRASPIPPIRVTKTLSAVSVKEVSEGVFIFDLGQNFAGWARLLVEGPKGTTVQMRMGELLYEDGSLNPMTAVTGQIKGLNSDGSPRGGPGSPEVAWQANTYTLRGDSMEEYTPRFTFHGFRYVEVTGFPGEPDISAIEGLCLNTDVESVGSFSCSNDQFNRIQEIVRWSLLSNIFSVQSDCPAREKFQYGGDIVASSEMAMSNFDMSTFYAKSVADFRESAQGDGWFPETAPFVGIAAANYAEGAGPIGWGLAHPLLMAQLYQYYGDIRVVEENYDAARNWVDLLETSSEGYIIDRCIGDHESLDPKPIELIATAQFYQAATMVAGFAELLAKSSEAERYRALARKIQAAFVARFLDVGTGHFGIATQAAQATALQLGLTPESEVSKAVERMVEAVVVDHDGHIATGIFGTKYLLNMLSDTGHADVAYDMVNKSEYPGWRHMLNNGATTLWETWAQSDNVYSQNHPMFGAVSEWFFKSLGGIKPEATASGFDQFRIEPFVAPDLDWVDVSYASVRGTISSSWRTEDGLLKMVVEVPVNTEAIVQFPTLNESSVRESGRPIAMVESVRVVKREEGESLRVSLGSGRYEFSASIT